jgi:hypothetical protein
MKKTLLFAIDKTTHEVIVSETTKGSNTIDHMERISRDTNDILFNAVVTLTSITNDPNFDVTLYKAMDKICVMIYNKHKGRI